MFEFEKRNHEHIGLESVELDDIYDLYPEMESISRMVENGYIPKMPGWKALDSPLYSNIGSG